MNVATPKERILAVAEEWKSCDACPYCETRTKIVHYRGFGPADIVFVGEGPGTIEDLQGKPFVGPSGRLLETMIADAFEQVVPIGWNVDRPIQPDEVVTERTKKWPRTAFLNLVACLPLTNGRIAAPTKQAIDSCRPRTLELISAANPRVVVRCGSQARVNLPDKLIRDLPRLVRISNVLHPAALLRQPNMHKDYRATVNEFVMLARELGFGQ